MCTVAKCAMLLSLLPLLFALASAKTATPYWEGNFRVAPLDTFQAAIYEGHGKIIYDPNEKSLQLLDNAAKSLMTIRLDNMRMPERPTFNDDLSLEYRFRVTHRPEKDIDTICQLSYEAEYFLNARGFYDAVVKLKNAALRGDRRIDYKFGLNLPVVTTTVSVLSDSDAWNDDRSANQKDDI